MKQKSHSGLKKRVKVNGKGKAFTQKANKNHLLVNKSKRQKNIQTVAVDSGRIGSVRKLLPGKIAN